MTTLLRAALLAAAAVMITTPAQAQFLFGDGFWNQPQRPSASQRGGSRAAAQQKRRPQVVQPWADDDDEDERPQRAAPRSAPGPAQRGPWKATWDGGGRPAIAPAAPPIVAYSGPQAAGTVVIDTRGRALYYVLGGGRAYRYSIAVGREGFTWTGTQRVSRIQAWPDWRPPAEMRQRQPHLPLLMTGGVHNPLGAKAIYLGSTLYRIHGTNDSRSIGSASSSGCFRMTNANVTHLASLVRIGTTVQVLRGLPASSRRNIATAGPAGGRS
jgi:lipoprotein-anchoring transpeptidase ErfK/SrfK